MAITIRKALEKDVKSMHKLIKELTIFEKAGDQVSITPEDLLRDGFRSNPAKYQAIVADKDGELIGMALYYFRYSTWKGSTLYLEDLIVTERFRRKGIGKALFEHVIYLSKKWEVARLEWQVLEWNHPAISFYDSINTNFDEEWVNCKLDKDQLDNYQFETIK